MRELSMSEHATANRAFAGRRTILRWMSPLGLLTCAFLPVARGEALPAGLPSPAAPVVAVNQVGYQTGWPKRFTAPVSPDGTAFSIKKQKGGDVLFKGVVVAGCGDFSAFNPADSDEDYVISLQGKDAAGAVSFPFAIRRELWRERFWPVAVDFMIDARSVVGTHPSAYGGNAWRDGTYYDFIVPSLILMLQADPELLAGLPRQIDGKADMARVMDPSFKYDAANDQGHGVLENIRKYYAEIEPPAAHAPDVVKLIHWGLGYYLVNPATKDPSGDPDGRRIHAQSVEQFAWFLHAWPQLKQWLPQSFHDRCRDFAFANWEKSGCLDISRWWDPKTYMESTQLTDKWASGGKLHPFKGRHAPGHSIVPNLLMHEVALREGRSDAGRYLDAAVSQAAWIVDNIDWNDPRTTKGQRMSEHKTIPSLVWLLQSYPGKAPAGLKGKIADWAKVAIARSANLWDFRRYDLDAHWAIPMLNEPGNLAGFPACALAASRVIDDPATRQRLRELAVSHIDNLFGRNPLLATAANFPEKGFPWVERAWPYPFRKNHCARLELCRGALCASPGSEMYPFNPTGKARHSEGWVNFNAAWNVSLAYLALDTKQARR